MSLRWKSLLLTTLVLAALLLLLAGLSTLIWPNSFERIPMIFLLLAGFAFGALTLAMMDHFILRRLVQLQNSVKYITASGDLTARIPVTTHDELSQLAQSINTMLDAHEQAQTENSRLLHETRRQLGELSLLHTAAIATARSGSLEAALQEIAQSAYDAFEAVNTLVLLYEPDQNRLKVRASVGVSTDTLAARQFQPGQGIIGEVARRGATILANDVARDPHYYAADSRTRSELCAPLKIGDRLIGVINVESDRLEAFATEDVRLLETLAHNLSMIVENLRLLDELRAANDQLTELDRLKSQFVANISHELRTPLNAILGFSELLSDEVSGPLNNEQRDFVQHIHTSGQHLLALINDILDLSKLQARRMDLDRRMAYFSDIAAAAQTFIWPAAQRKQLIIDSDVPPNLPAVLVDQLRIKQVLINLLNNACKFTPPDGHITLRAEVWQADWLRVSVSDTGPGISPDKQAVVFDEFSQLEQERTLTEHGTGLGLTIARRLIELHGGRIWVESTGQPGEGTTFFFTLPVADTAARARRAGTRVLAVNHDPLLIDMLQSILLPPDYEVFGVSDAAFVFERAERDQPDVILLDLSLPQHNAIQLLAALQQEPRTARIPVVVLTASAVPPVERAAIDRWAVAALTRTPLRRADLLQALQQARSAATSRNE